MREGVEREGVRKWVRAEGRDSRSLEMNVQY